MRPHLTRELALAAAKDAATAHMRKAGRSTWSEEDSNVCWQLFNRLWPMERDL